MSGSQPRFPPGELSNMKPKSEQTQTTRRRWVGVLTAAAAAVRARRTDVDEVSFAVQHDVPVVAVFDLQQEQQEAVGRHAADEVVASLQEGEGMLVD